MVKKSWCYHHVSCELPFPLFKKVLPRQTHTNQRCWGTNYEVQEEQETVFHINGQWSVQRLLGLGRLETWLLGAGRRKKGHKKKSRETHGRMKNTHKKKRARCIQRKFNNFPSSLDCGNFAFPGNNYAILSIFIIQFVTSCLGRPSTISFKQHLTTNTSPHVI